MLEKFRKVRKMQENSENDVKLLEILLNILKISLNFKILEILVIFLKTPLKFMKFQINSTSPENSGNVHNFLKIPFYSENDVKILEIL